MQRMDLQKQAAMLIEQLSTEKLKEVVHYLADLRDKDAQNAAPLLDLMERFRKRDLEH